MGLPTIYIHPKDLIRSSDLEDGGVVPNSPKERPHRGSGSRNDVDGGKTRHVGGGGGL